MTENIFYLDGDAWSCPNCPTTRRVRGATNQQDLDLVRRAIRDNHKCPPAYTKGTQK